MKRVIRKLIPNTLVNFGKHLPTAVLANLRYRYPSKGMKIIGVTGTDGKTTTTNMIYQILKAAGKKVSMVSSINAQIGDKTFDTGFHVTSPSSFDVQKYLAKAKKDGSEYFVLEVTSHGLSQFRTWGIKFDVGVITNVTHEHLDYHGSFKNYLKTKSKLIKNAKVAVINRDEAHFNELFQMAKGKVVSFGFHKTADFNPLKFPLKIKIPGEYNLANALAASAACYSLGIETKNIRETLAKFAPLEGRMQKIPNDLGINIVVDFAHTPNALENALNTLKRQTKGKIIAVFGAASERDTTKRPLMGEISGKLSDFTVLTDEDPRFEDRMKIIDEIAKGAKKADVKEGVNLYKEPDRKKAIKLAISLAKKGDTIGIFGKGHEQSMNYQGVEKPWSDRRAVEEILNGGTFKVVG